MMKHVKTILTLALSFTSFILTDSFAVAEAAPSISLKRAEELARDHAINFAFESYYSEEDSTLTIQHIGEDAKNYRFLATLWVSPILCKAEIYIDKQTAAPDDEITRCTPAQQ